jgi:hypothetical protein
MACTRGMGVALLIGIILNLSAGCGHLIYPSGPYSGRIVDAETSQPIAGAAVIATWTREIPIAPHMPEQDWDVYETLSDVNGEFTIPHRTHFTWFGWIEEPTLIVYDPAFAPAHLGEGDRADQGPPGAPLTIRLKRLKDRAERVLNAGRPVGTDSLAATKIPNLLRLIDDERRQLGLEPYAAPRTKP